MELPKDTVGERERASERANERERQAGRQTNRQTDTRADRYTHTLKQSERAGEGKEGERGRERQRQTERERLSLVFSLSNLGGTVRPVIANLRERGQKVGGIIIHLPALGFMPIELAEQEARSIQRCRKC